MGKPTTPDLRVELERWAASLGGGWQLADAAPLAPDDESGGDTHKAMGYGRPLRLTLRDASGREQRVVFHVAGADEFGHDRRSDRALEQLLAYDTFGAIPRHVRALDVGAVTDDGRILLLRDTGEFYLVTEWADGRPYAEDLRALARRGHCDDRDLLRVDALVDYLVALHRERVARPAAYARAARDLVGSGEGIFGMIDGYPPEVVPAERLRALEHRCLDWRWRLRRHPQRAARIHGDFHPFNVLFSTENELRLLDASRGCVGDPADDVTAMCVNYVFFAVEHRQSWRDGLGVLWHRFWSRYRRAAGDELLEVAAPFFAWRSLVVASPRFYPELPREARDRLLGLVERVLEAPRFDPALADELFR